MQLHAGNVDALAELFSHYQDRLRKIIHFRLDYRLAGRVSESDVIQDTYLCASQRIGHYTKKRSSMSFFLWLRLLANQRLTELYRQHVGAEMRDVRREVSLDASIGSPQTSLALANHLAASVSSPSQAVARVEKISLLEKALNTMSPLDREVIALRHFEELTSAETAQYLGIQRSAASKRYLRAMTRLKGLISSLPGLTDN